MKNLRKTKADSLQEYAVVFAVVVAVFTSMFTLLKRGFQGRVADLTDATFRSNKDTHLQNSGKIFGVKQDLRIDEKFDMKIERGQWQSQTITKETKKKESQGSIEERKEW